MKKIMNQILGVVLIVIAAIWISGCKDPDYAERTNEEILIGEYFEQHPDSFSLFSQVLERSRTQSFLKAYGNYTCFAPTNDALTRYITSKGKTSVTDFTENELKQLVRFCVINDTVPSEMFVDGRMEYPTLYGQYLTTGTYFEDEAVVVKVNKYANIINKDIRVTNGIIHTVSEVLEPDVRTIAEYLEQTEGYKIFSDALKETGLYDLLDTLPSPDKDTTWFTVFAIPDAVYQDAEIASLEDLIETYGSEVDESGHDSLYYYMAYHILSNQYHFINDLVSERTVKTTSPSEVLTVKAIGTKVLINDDYFAGNYEPGFEINREASDIPAGNGVIHVMNGNFAIKARFPFAVYWEVTNQLELRKMPGIYQKSSLYGITNGQLADISWLPESATIDYLYPFGPNGSFHAVFDDAFQIYLRPDIIASVTFTTPTLVKGTYKIWVGQRNQTSLAVGRACQYQVYFNGVTTGKLIKTHEAPGLSEGVAPTDGELNLRGFKVNSYKPSDFYATDSATIQNNIARGLQLNWFGNDGWGRYASTFAGTVEVTETGTQQLKFVSVAGGNGGYLWLDQIHFIPVEENQNWPRVNTKDGSLVYLEDLLAGNLPSPY